MSWQPQQGGPPQGGTPQASQQSVGDLPGHARERLTLMRGDATPRPFFTSGLSVNALLLMSAAGSES